MTATPLHLQRGTTRRRHRIALELAGVAVFCIAGFLLLSPYMQRFEAHVVAWMVRTVMGTRAVSAVTAPQLLLFPRDHRLLSAFVSPACSSLLSILGLASLSFAVLRRRGGHALLGFAVAAILVTVANDLRMAACLALGLIYGKFWLIAFHNWAGTLWNFAATLGGFLVMVFLSLPTAERAEQSAVGHHTAHRPSSWARPGLGYQGEGEEQRREARRTMTAFLYRRLLPRPVARRMARQREAHRIDYRLGHLSMERRVEAVRALCEDGLGVHTATLLAVASYDDDEQVLDALATSIAARQWEPVVSEQVAALRLWARAWLHDHPEMQREGRDVTRSDTPPSPDADPSAQSGPVAERPAGKLAALRGLERLVPAGFASTPPLDASLRPAAEHLAPISKPGVLVTGAGGPAGVAVIRRLRALGHPVIAVDADFGAAGFALASTWARVPLATEEAYRPAVLDVVRAQRPAALICTVAEELRVLSEMAGELAALGCATSLPDPDAVERCSDKARFAVTMAVHGVPHPMTEVLPGAASALPGPWIVKPRRGRGSRGVVRAETVEQLRAAMDAGGDVIVQPRVAGKEFTADTLVDHCGRLLACVPRWREEVRSGISVKGSTFASSTVLSVVTDALAAVKLRGPACVQGFVTDEGAVTIIEMNPRFSGGLPLTLAAGADVVGAYLTDILSPETPVDPLDFRPGVRMARYFAEVYTDEEGGAVADPCSL